MGLGWWRAETALRQELDLLLAGEAEGLVRDYEAIGPQALLDAARISARRDALLLVLVQTADGQTLAGRMAGAPAALRGYATIRAPGEPPLRALGALLPGGINLLVAAPLSAAEGAARALAWTPLIAALGSGAMALLLGFVAARALERRLASVSDVAGLLTAGDLSRRLPQSGRGDEFDRLVLTVNAMLTKLEMLVAAQREVTDNIAHDLRGPLQRLRQGLEEALAVRRDDPALAASIAELDAVLETFAALLRIARAEAGAGARQALDLSALVASVAEAYAPVRAGFSPTFRTCLEAHAYQHRRKISTGYGRDYDFGFKSGDVVAAELWLPEGPNPFHRSAERFAREADIAASRMSFPSPISAITLLGDVISDGSVVEAMLKVRAFVTAEMLPLGLGVDAVIHDPAGKESDVEMHAHLLISCRSITHRGFGSFIRIAKEGSTWERWKNAWARTVAA